MKNRNFKIVITILKFVNYKNYKSLIFIIHKIEKHRMVNYKNRIVIEMRDL